MFGVILCKFFLHNFNACFFFSLLINRQLKKWISSKLATLQDPSPEVIIESEKYIMQQNLFAKLSQVHIYIHMVFNLWPFFKIKNHNANFPFIFMFTLKVKRWT